MPLEKFQGVELPASADFHVHLRDGAMMELVTGTIRQGGVNTVYVMPNLVPPVTTVQHALDYWDKLHKIEPNVTFLMSLYLHPSITPEAIIRAKKAGITGVKSYPAGVTTNSSAGVVDYASFYAVFEEMERQDLILNLHGELPSVSVDTAEQSFLPTLLSLHARFPRLRIILEHCTSAAAIEAVKSCGPTVAATITAHHLYLTKDDWAGTNERGGDPFCFCKPVAKTPEDRLALLRTAASGNPKFFLGTDSAPHPVQKKREEPPAAGVFTQPYATQLVLDALEQGCVEGVLKEEDVTREVLEGFLGGFGRAFYRVEHERKEKITIGKRDERIMQVLKDAEGATEVVPFRRGQRTWSVAWK